MLPARNIETELIPACRRYGLDIVIYNPIAGGLLSGKYKTHDVPAEGRYSDTSSTGGMYRKRYFKDANFEALSVIEPVVEKHGLTLVETALRWVRYHSALEVDNGGRDGLIIGVSSFSQLESNLRDLQKGPLPEEVVEALDKAWLIAKPYSPNYWHLDLKYTYDTQAERRKASAGRTHEELARLREFVDQLISTLRCGDDAELQHLLNLIRSGASLEDIHTAVIKAKAKA